MSVRERLLARVAVVHVITTPKPVAWGKLLSEREPAKKRPLSGKPSSYKPRPRRKRR